MKILHLCYWDKAGGASIAAYRLHHSFLANGYDSTMLVFEKSQDEPEIVSIKSTYTKIWNTFYNRITSRFLALYRPFVGNFSINIFGKDLSGHPLVQNADIIYIHWINNSMLSLRGISQILKQGKIVIWFLHDMYPITGGCHHSLECSFYKTHCSHCVLLGSRIKRDISYYQFEDKIKYLKPYSNLIIATPSTWMSNCAKQSYLFCNHTIVTIPNSVDTTQFAQVPKAIARRMLDLPLNKKIILFGADMGINNPYKGWNYLREALSMLSEKNEYQLLTFGSNNTEHSIIEGIDCYAMGRITDNKKLNYLYSSSDVFVVPSLAESFGQTIIEAMSSGTLVVAFNTGGIPDVIQHQQNGYLASFKNSTSLKEGIDWCISNSNIEMSKQCHDSIVERFDTSSVIAKHIVFIESI